MEPREEAAEALRKALAGAEKLVEDLKRALDGLQGSAVNGPSQEDLGVASHLRDIVDRGVGDRQK